MVVREEALAERLALLRSTVVRLRAAASRDLNDDWDEWALERGMQLAAQALFDVGNHVLAGAFGTRPKDYAEVAPELARRGVIGEDLATRLQGLAGFRNLLVHEYAKVDPVNSPIDDEALSDLYADSTWPNHTTASWNAKLERAIIYVCAYSGDVLVGFVFVAWDGGIHGFLLEPTVPYAPSSTTGCQLGRARRPLARR